MEKTDEIDKKDEIIRRIQTEKSEIEHKFEISDIKEAEARKEIEILKEELQKYKSEITVEDIRMEIEEDHNKNSIEDDGIK